MSAAPLRRVLVAGSGLAGLSSARRLVDHAVGDVVLVDPAEEAGGTSRLSRGWIWVYRDSQTLATYAPGGDSSLGQAIVDGFEPAVRRLAGWGVEIIESRSRNPLTRAVRVHPATMVDRLVSGSAAAGVHMRFGTALAGMELVDDEIEVTLAGPSGTASRERFSQVILAGGGHIADKRWSAAEFSRLGPSGRQPAWIARHAGVSDGSTQRAAAAAGASLEHEPAGHAVAFARLLADIPDPSNRDFVETAVVFGSAGVLVAEGYGRLEWSSHDWSDSLRANRLAAAGGNGWLVLSDGDRSAPTPYGSVEEVARRVQARGAWVLDAGPELADLAEVAGVSAPWCAIPVRAAATHTCLGLRVDEGCCVLDPSGRPIAAGRVLAAGVDVGGLAGTGYVSGLSQALVLGITAADNVAAGIASPA